MIVKIKGGFQVQSEKGKNLGIYKTRKAAVTRLGQIEFFKHKGK